MPQISLIQLAPLAKSGEALISFPTDTVPALAARPDRAALIFAAKQRSETKPLILMGGDATDLWDYVQGSEAERRIWQAIATRYWPGALTLVLPASPQLPEAMNPIDPTTIGIRVPDHPIAQQILRLTGPLATTSVNRSGEPPLLTLTDINAQFPEVYTLSTDELAQLEQQYGLEAASGQPSTVVKWQGDRWEVLRQGGIGLDRGLDR
jgi:L-threonylcarbamoyladenylate synthase